MVGNWVLPIQIVCMTRIIGSIWHFQLLQPQFHPIVTESQPRPRNIITKYYGNSTEMYGREVGSLEGQTLYLLFCPVKGWRWNSHRNTFHFDSLLDSVNDFLRKTGDGGRNGNLWSLCNDFRHLTFTSQSESRDPKAVGLSLLVNWHFCIFFGLFSSISSGHTGKVHIMYLM